MKSLTVATVAALRRMKINNPCVKNFKKLLNCVHVVTDISSHAMNNPLDFKLSLTTV